VHKIKEAGKKRILVVDDQASDSHLVKRYLEATEQYVVREENDPKAALATAEQFKPQLILLDLLMPEMAGTELAACFKANPGLRAVPIVFMTAKLTKEEVVLFGGRIGGYQFLAKPIVLAEMTACLRRHLEI
jgi:PleD family two-component response regulator